MIGKTPSKTPRKTAGIAAGKTAGKTGGKTTKVCQTKSVVIFDATIAPER